MLRNAHDLEGFELTANDGPIGSIKDLYFDDEQWRVRYFVVKGDAWLSGRSVLIAPSAMIAPQSDDRRLVTTLTKDQVRNSPEIDLEREVSRQQEEQLHRHYAWPMYWTPQTALGTSFTAPISPVAEPTGAVRGINELPRTGTRQDSPMEVEARVTGSTDHHLRSASVVRGYHIEANDGAIGHVEDFVVDDTDWSVRYMLVDTSNWWAGRKVLVPLLSISTIDAPTATVRVELTRDQIKNGPEYDASRPMARDYTDRLDAHFGKMGRRAQGTEGPKP